MAGRSEEVLGKAISRGRQSAVLATKAAIKSGPGVNDSGLSRKHLMQGIEDSLRRLKTDYVDVYYVHFPDKDTPMDETLRTLDDMVHQGKSRYIACSNFHAWRLAKALWISDMHDIARFDCIQTPYNLLTRDIEYELVPLCDSEAVGLTCYNPLAAGLLTGKHDFSQPPAAGTRFALEKGYYMRYWSEANFKAVNKVGQIAAQEARLLPQFALACTLNCPTVTAAIGSATSIKQMDENLCAAEIKLTPKEIIACNEIWQDLRPPRFFYGR
ncbi:MAG: aldo/keto reductase [Dehalococcoidales bacterium]|nr:aldo/keto reductase [Dehalococcoidales bacterium]